MSYVSYILLLTCQHGQPVQDWGGGQGVRPLHQDLDEVAGSKLSKIKFEHNLIVSSIADIFYDKTVIIIKMFKCSHQ